MSVTAVTDLRKAERTLASAHLLLETEQAEGACNRAYYAIVRRGPGRAARGRPRGRGRPARTHRGLIAAFGRDLVQTGRFDAVDRSADPA